MRTITPEELEDFAGQYAVAIDLAQRDYVACRVAHAISSDPVVSAGLVLKGGFVLRMGHGSPRTSKDIDGTIGTRKQVVDPKRLQRVVRGLSKDLGLSFAQPILEGTDTLDFGVLDYSGPFGSGKLSLELSFREDLILKRTLMTIDAFGVPSFQIPAMALAEIVAEKWRCLVQRPPRRPGDPYDLWFLWTVVRHREPDPDNELRPDDLSRRCAGPRRSLRLSRGAGRGRLPAQHRQGGDG